MRGVGACGSCRIMKLRRSVDGANCCGWEGSPISHLISSHLGFVRRIRITHTEQVRRSRSRSTVRNEFAIGSEGFRRQTTSGCHMHMVGSNVELPVLSKESHVEESVGVCMDMDSSSWLFVPFDR